MHCSAKKQQEQPRWAQGSELRRLAVAVQPLAWAVHGQLLEIAPLTNQASRATNTVSSHAPA